MGPHLPVLAAEPLADGLARRISYLRLSVTDRCNFRCTYCMPESGVDTLPRSELLDFDELQRLVTIFAALGVKRLRLTGGEPTVRKGIVELCSRLAAVQGIDELVMTSNGRLLSLFASALARAGLREVNISLDTLDPDRFERLTRRRDLGAVIEGIDAALRAELRVKLNTVALAQTNRDELAEICSFAWKRGVVPRFIEHMPMSGGQTYSAGGHLSAAEIRASLAERFGPLTPEAPGDHRGPARYWRCAGGRFGVISAMSEHFCDSCNRLRLSSTGELHTCLGYDDATDLRALLRAERSDAAIARAIRQAVLHKRPGHRFDMSGGGGPQKHMISIGG